MVSVTDTKLSDTTDVEVTGTDINSASGIDITASESEKIAVSGTNDTL